MTGAEKNGVRDNQGDEEIIQAAFGHKNRARLLENYFSRVAPKDITAASAWSHVYRLLLWTDQTTGLVHCYESDKCQPGKPWYGRSLAFHDWLSDAWKAHPAKVSEMIDWMFQKAANELAAAVVRKASALSASAKRQREPYAGKGLPSPGEDPELVVIVRKVLGSHLKGEPSPEKWRELVQRLRQYLMLDNKRKNLLGEGFEDVLGALLRRSCSSNVEVHTRGILHDLPGFANQKKGEKVHKVDLAVIRPAKRTLVTVKWSVRADREKQFLTDYHEYVAAESSNKRWEYVFVTNEFDPARLHHACEKLVGNNRLFEHVVHINTDALRAAYGSCKEERMRKVLEFIDEGRLLSLERWITLLSK